MHTSIEIAFISEFLKTKGPNSFGKLPKKSEKLPKAVVFWTKQLETPNKRAEKEKINFRFQYW